MPIRVQTEDFDIGAEISSLRKGRTDIGAIVTFTGTVRGNKETEALTTMTLEHYPEMTENELTKIQQDAQSRWPLIDSLIIHRIGELQPGDNIVLVVTLSAHRQAAFEAANFLMDYLKSNAPFWKKEKTQNGNTEWVDARESDGAALKRWQDN